MKRILLFVLLVCSINYAQTSQRLLLLGGDLQTETRVYLSSLTTPLSKAQVTRIDKFVKMVKDSLQISSLSSKFDVLYLLANETSEAGLKNLVKRNHDATAVNSPTFTQWEGFQGNGTSSYINTNYNDSTQGVASALNSQAFGLYYLALDTIDGVWDMGHFGDTYGSIMGNQDNEAAGRRVYVNAPYSNLANRLFGTGLKIYSRVNATQVSAYLNGTLAQTIASGSFGVPNSNWGILAAYVISDFTDYTSAKVSFAFIGAGLTTTEVSKLTNCVEWYMDSLNRGVIP